MSQRHVRNMPSRWLTLVLIALVLVGATCVPTSAQRGSPGYATPNGLAVTWSGDWMVEDQFATAGESSRYGIALGDDDAREFQVLEYELEDDGFSIASLRDATFVLGVQTANAEGIELGTEDDTAYGLWISEARSLNSRGVMAAVFATDSGHVVLIVVAGPLPAIAETFAAVSAGIRIDDTNPFAVAGLFRRDIAEFVDTFANAEQDRTGATPVP